MRVEFEGGRFREKEKVFIAEVATEKHGLENSWSCIDG